MQIADFVKPSGELYRTLEGHLAYVPAPLPPRVSLDGLWDVLGDTAQVLGELKGAARRTQNPRILITPLQRREALTTSAMEGTHTSIENLIFQETGLSTKQDDNARETSNFVSALRQALKDVERYAITHRVIKAAHATLLSGLPVERGSNKRPGEFKRNQNWIGGSKDINTARYVPPPPERTQKCMDDLEAYINREPPSVLQRIIDLALAHYQFEAIHPFADGNGRIGRMLITLMAQQSRLLDQPLLYLSPYLERRKDEYIDLMCRVSTQSAWQEWIAFFAEAVRSTCQDTIEKIDALMALQARYKALGASAGRSAKLPEMIETLFHSPFTTVPRVMEKFGITYSAAQSILEKLTRAGILRNMPGTYPRVYVAQDILDISNRT